MTAPARLTKTEIRTAMQTVASSGFDSARVIMDFAKGKIEVIIGESASSTDRDDYWTDED